MGHYDTAQICLNGHCINDSYHGSPSLNKKFCDQCGEKTITQCQNCGSEIPGYYEVPDVLTLGGHYGIPDYCGNCGKPFPWLERKMKAAIELASLEEVLTKEEEEQFSNYVKDITVDTPSSQVSAKKITILLRRFAGRSIGELRALLVEIASETAKKVITNQ